MGEILDFLFAFFKILIPASVLVITTQILLKNHFDERKRKDRILSSKVDQYDLSPLQFQAYERLILFVERLQPDNLMLRSKKSKMTSRDLHTTMLKTIRNEYEHNMTQQLYVSPKSWKMVLMAKEEVTKLINLAATQIPEDATSAELGKSMMSIIIKMNKMPTDVAIYNLKSEFQQKFKS